MAIRARPRPQQRQPLHRARVRNFVDRKHKLQMLNRRLSITVLELGQRPTIVPRVMVLACLPPRRRVVEGIRIRAAVEMVLLARSRPSLLCPSLHPPHPQPATRTIVKTNQDQATSLRQTLEVTYIFYVCQCMVQSLALVLVGIILSTQNRNPFLPPAEDMIVKKYYVFVQYIFTLGY